MQNRRRLAPFVPLAALVTAVLAFPSHPASAEQATRLELRHFSPALSAVRSGGNLGAIPKSVPITGSADFLFVPTQASQQTTETCLYFCLSPQDGPQFCGSGQGTVSIGHGLSGPFSATNFRLVSVLQNSCDGSPVTMPAKVGVGQALVFDLTFTPSSTGNFTDFLEFDSDNYGYGFVYNVFGTSVSNTCSPSATTACLNYGRFAVSATFDTGNGKSVDAQLVQLTQDTASMWFFSADNIETEVKVIDGCPLNGHYWVFAGGLTNVRVVMTVVDTLNGATQTYTNQLNHPFQPLQDTAAFSSCP